MNPSWVEVDNLLMLQCSITHKLCSATNICAVHNYFAGYRVPGYFVMNVCRNNEAGPNDHMDWIVNHRFDARADLRTHPAMVFPEA